MKKLGNEVEFLMLVRGNTDYANLLTKSEILQAQNSSLTKVDLLITCTEEVYQDYTFDIVGPKNWNTMIDKARYESDMDTFVKHATAVFGKVLDEEGFLRLVGEYSSSTPVKDRPAVEDLKRSAAPPAIAHVKEEPVKEATVSIEDGDFADLLQR